MKELAIICAVLMVLPFVLGYIQRGVSKEMATTITYYRYFVCINVIFSALFVAVRMFLQGPQAAASSGWAYSPVFHLYGVALLSVALMSCFTLFKQERIMVAPAMCWSFFLVLSSITHIYQIMAHDIKGIGIIWVHIIYNIAVTFFLQRFIVKINRHFFKAALVDVSKHENDGAAEVTNAAS
jgi:hypothetical protein